MFTNRRHLLQGAAILAGASLLPTSWARQQKVSFSRSPFALGVASGDPDASSVVLWTRLVAAPMEPDFGVPQEPIAVRWELASDDGFKKILKSGTVEAHPNSAHAVHVVAEGLKPDSHYWYRFHAGDATSPVGRTRTTPTRGSKPKSFRYAFAGCQRYENGYYTAWRDAAQSNADVVFFLGDYIYENGRRPDLPRQHPDEMAQDLASYRRRYGLYKSDKDIQAAHAAAPWFVLWDDHEVVNNYKDTRSPGVADAQEFLKRKAAAYQVWYEHMPVRPSSAPVGTNIKIYRSMEWGRLAKVQLIDGRQYATWTDWPEKEGSQEHILDSELRNDPKRSMLGAEQEAWLYKSFADSQATWNVLAQQYAMVELYRAEDKTGVMGYGNDSWDGYPATRERVLQNMDRVANPMVLGSDMHSFAQSDLRLKSSGKLVAPGFVAGAISSPSAGGYPMMQKMMADNPDFRFSDNRFNGYSIVDVSEKQSVVTMRAVDNVALEASGVHDLAKYVIENGKRGAARL